MRDCQADQAVHTETLSLRRRAWRLLLCVTAIVVLWGIVLPRLSQQRVVRERIERDTAYGIDPSAMFYTEVGIEPMTMDDYRRRHEARRNADEESR